MDIIFFLDFFGQINVLNNAKRRSQLRANYVLLDCVHQADLLYIRTMLCNPACSTYDRGIRHAQLHRDGIGKKLLL